MRKIIDDGDDPWSRLSRSARDAARGVITEHEELGDTANLMRRGPQPVTLENPHDALRSINEALKAFPDRADLWSMRFELQRVLGLKAEFAAALVSAWRNSSLAQRLDWASVHALWQELAPGEPVPEGIKLPNTPPKPVQRLIAGTPQRQLRFSELAIQICPRELGVLAKAYAALRIMPGFLEGFSRKTGSLLKRPTPFYFAPELSRLSGGENRIFLKREDRRRVAVELENSAAQAYVAWRLGKTTVLTGNDVEAHSLAMAEVAPLFGLKYVVVVLPADLEQKPALIERLREKGAAVETTAGLPMIGEDPREGALRLWQKSLGQAHLALSLGTGPDPYPVMAQDLQSLLGRETELQFRAAGGRRPWTLVAAVGSEADSIGFMLPHLGRNETELVYAVGDLGEVARQSVRLRAYSGGAREHARMRSLGRIEHVPMSDAQALTAQQQLGTLENINVSLEDARALALAMLLTQRNPGPHDFAVLVA